MLLVQLRSQFAELGICPQSRDRYLEHFGHEFGGMILLERAFSCETMCDVKASNSSSLVSTFCHRHGHLQSLSTDDSTHTASQCTHEKFTFVLSSALRAHPFAAQFTTGNVPQAHRRVLQR